MIFFDEPTRGVDVFDYIEMFYNPKRKHANNAMLSPVNFEVQQKLNPQGVQKMRGYSHRGKMLTGQSKTKT